MSYTRTWTPEESAAAIAKRAKQIQDACIAAGVTSNEIIAAAVIADALDDVATAVNRLDDGERRSR